ncbi:MAG: 5-methyltetrahydropteroyltriglutamate--homocysteine methyltransferase [Pseudomonadales bacterium]|nr:5-methyltetrahydropteroyltriglutamate--homocysteine methyltransferase [Pseudomonadales bacterium]MCP5185058.1 5-methyltetrahydropteroyltriglutamate--homocysteine methyltransferase [Pseudomonadales bacterium]
MAVDPLPPLAAGLVGSYAQPDWLIDKARLGERLPPRVRALELWRVPPEHQDEAFRDATLMAVNDQLRAGVDFVTDGEIRRESYSNRFATSLSGVDLERHGEAIDRTGKAVPVPRITGPIQRQRSMETDYVALLKAYTDKPVKVTLPGPFTMTQQAQDDYYGDEMALALAYAQAVNEEVKALFAAGADIVQLDEPYVQARPEAARRFAVAAINRALADVTGPTVLHVCFGYGRHVDNKPDGYAFLEELNDCAAAQLSLECAQPRLDPKVLAVVPDKIIQYGVIDLRDTTVETPEVVADRLRAALTVIPPERLIVAPDCGMKYLARDVAYGKLVSMVRGRDIVRQELGLG